MSTYLCWVNEWFGSHALPNTAEQEHSAGLVIESGIAGKGNVVYRHGLVLVVSWSYIVELNIVGTITTLSENERSR